MTSRLSRQGQVALGVLALTSLALCYVAVHLGQVHRRSYEYRWSPSAAAPRIQFDGRDYHRSRSEPASTLPTDEVPLGRTEGGGRIYGPSGPREYALTVIHVVTEDRAFAYTLSGGP